jgi:arginyl-tRNA synthetase
VYLTLTNRLREALAQHIRQKYAITLPVVLERPPKLELGEAASPVAFELAKQLKRAPRQIAQEIAESLPMIAGIAKVEVAGAGYLNAFFNRAGFWSGVRGETSGQAPDSGHHEKVIVEHTSINPNKAAHIGHLRNAALGDTLVRTLRHAGRNVQVQNYIDNTGVQVADVVIAFLNIEQRTPVSVKMMTTEPRFDYLCWDLYAQATQFFDANAGEAAKLRAATLKAIEENYGEEAEVAEVVADAIASCHLRTMARLGIRYDLLARESEILHLKFWETAFEKLKETGAIQLATGGKMAGCWIMPWKEEAKEGKEAKEVKEPASDAEEISQDKIIVRSNGTVTYVGKDIAYQLWKFGLLGKDFRYMKWLNPPEGETVWSTTSMSGDSHAPHFGKPAKVVFNVIDSRQAYLQQVVAMGLRALGHAEEADNSIHLSYEIVALTPRCATEMGYQLSEEDAKRSYVEVSGRKGMGVKADDLMDKLEAATLAEVKQRHPDMALEEQQRTAHAIAVGALRFFLLKFTRNAIIAFDFNDALSFEGETGPYCQYAVVRIRGIRRKEPEITTQPIELTVEIIQDYLDGAEGQSLWELLFVTGSLDSAVDATISAHEPAFLAKYAFQLAQAFNNFYHKHHILSESDGYKRAFLLALTGLVEKQLVKTLELLGIEAPEKM